MGIHDVTFQKALKIKKNGICIIQHGHSFVMPVDGKKLKEIRARVFAAPRSFTVTTSYNIQHEFLLLPITKYIIESIHIDKFE